MSSGYLFHDYNQGMSISGSLEGVAFLNDLPCGTHLDVLIGDYWQPTRLEHNLTHNRWYFVGLDIDPTSVLARV